jgi:hypothetical protein
MRSVLLGAVLAVLAATSVAHADLTITNGGLWRIDTRLTVAACLAGQCDRERAQTSDDVSLSAGTIVQIRLLVFGCEVDVADYCDFVPRRNGKLKIVKCDKRAIADVLRDCSPYELSGVRRVGGFERMAPDGQSFKWKATVAFTVRTQGQAVSVNAVATVNGTLVAAELTNGDPAPGTLDLAPDASPLVESLIGEVVGR